MSGTWRLFQLQKADTRLTELDKALRALRADQQHRQLLQEALTALEDSEATLRQSRKELREMEHEDSTLRTRARMLEGKLYGGRISNPKELSGYQDELQAVQVRLGTLEETMLSRMEELEALEDEHRGLAARTDQARRDHDERQEALERKIASLEDESSSLQQRRSEQASEIEPGLLKRYSDLLARKNGVAVARINRQTCGGCGMHLTDHKIQEAGRDGLTFCSTCSRILYLEG